MDSSTRAHLENLLQLNRAHLRELETQQAKLGVLAPSGIAVQIAEYARTIADLERQLAEALPRHNLPPRDYERFVGRQKELEEIRRLLLPYPKSRHHLVTIDGIGGIGKSALALETAYQARDGYASLPEPERFEAIVWVSAKRTHLTADGILEQRQAFRTLDDLYAAIAQVLDYPAITRAPAEEQRAIVERVLSEQRTLLILDNLETVDDEALLVFLRLLPDPTKAIVTTRHRIDVAYPVRLLGMPQADALALIEQEAARKDVTLDKEEQQQLFARTGGVPLAIVWSIGLMGLGGSAESVLRRLGSGQSDIARFCFDESVAQIRGRDAHKLLLALSLFASDASREALGVVAGLGEDEFGRDIGLEELLRLSLVNKEGNRFGLLPLTRSYVQTEASKQMEWMGVRRERLYEYIFSLVESGSSEKQDWQATDSIERELTNIVPAFDHMVASLRYIISEEKDQRIIPELEGQARRLLRLNRTLVWVCRIRGYWTDCERLCLTGIAISKAIGDAINAGFRYHDLSKICYFRYDLVKARYWALEARTSFERAGLIKSVCYANRTLGLIALRSGDIEQAEILLHQAIDAYTSQGGVGALPSYLGTLGELSEAQGDLKAAELYYQQAIDILRQKNNIHNLAADMLNLGRVMLAQADFNTALVYFNESLKLAQECGRIDVIARSRYSIAILKFSMGDEQSAESNARQALDLFRRLGMKREQAEALLARLGDGTAETLNS